MTEKADDPELDKFLYGEEFKDNTVPTPEKEANEEELEEEEDDEDDYEIILDSTKLNASQGTGSSDINKRSLTSVAIEDGDGKGGAIGDGTGDGTSGNQSSTATGTTGHFDPFAPGNLNNISILNHDLDSFEDKPWRKPGADLTDYFNFGFNEVTWRAYCIKQKALREEFGLQKKIGVYDSSSNSNNNNNTNATGGSYQNSSNANNANYSNNSGNYTNNYNNNSNSNSASNYNSGYHHQSSSRPPYNRRPPPPSNEQYRDLSRGDRDQFNQSTLSSSRYQNRDQPIRSRYNSPSPPSTHQAPPPPPSRSRSRSRSPRRQVSSYSHRSRHQDPSPRSPPTKRRRD